MSVLLFEDAIVAQLFPITTARPSFSITVGSFRLIDWVRRLEQPLAAIVRPHLRSIVEADFSDLWQPSLDCTDRMAGPQLLLNARLIPNVSNFQEISRLWNEASSTAAGIVWDGDQVAAIINPGWSWQAIANQSTNVESLLLTAHNFESRPASLKLMTYPHEVIAANMQHIADNLQFRISHHAYTQTTDGVFLAEGAKLDQFIITDTSKGPIVIDQNAYVGPYTLLRGPIFIGAGAKILEHSAIKDQVSLGHTTKIGGEVEAAIVEPFSNKQHHGFLGHSYLGSWINLGAGTCNSDLKNTYGTVNMEYPHGKSATGMQFLGCVMGDYSKTAINTGIFTGKVVGVCSMMYGFVTSNVPSFVNYARLFGQMTTLPPEVMIATQQRMFARRKVQQRPCDMQLLHDMYRLTQNERDRFGDALAF